MTAFCKRYRLALPVLFATSLFITGCRSVHIADTRAFRPTTTATGGDHEAPRPTTHPATHDWPQPRTDTATTAGTIITPGYELDPVLTLVPLDDHAATAPPEPRTYTVQRGDTLSGIARKMYGGDDQGSWKMIHEANVDTLASPDDLRPGMQLVIP